MPVARIFKLVGYERSDLPILARVEINGVAVTQSQLDAIKLHIRRFIRSTGAVETVTPDAGVSVDVSHIYNALQTGAAWTKDSIGYNFSYTIDRQYFDGPDEYEIVFLFDPTSAQGGNPFPVIIRATMLSLQGVPYNT